MSSNDCRRNSMIIILAAVLVTFFVLISAAPVSVYAVLQHSSNGSENMHHEEYGDMCVHALDVSMSSSQVEKYIKNDELEEKIVSKSSVEIRYAPYYKISNETISADVSEVSAEASSAGYDATLTLPGGKHMDIKVYVRNDASAAAGKVTEKRNEIVREDPSRLGIMIGTAGFAAIAGVVLFLIIPDVMIILWHRRLLATNSARRNK